MDDITNTLSQILSNPQSMQQIQNIASSLGLGGGDAPALPSAGDSGAVQPEAQPESGSGLDLSALSGLLGGGANEPQSTGADGGGLDLSALSGLLGNLGSGTGASPPAQPQTPDLSALQGLISGIAGGGGQQGGQGSGDLSALTALLSGGKPPAQSQAPGLPFDLNTLLKVQKAMSSFSSNKGNIDLLLALKPRLKADRAKKVDDAIRVMQLIQFLPLIKESGLFGDLDSGQGLSGLVGGLGNGIGDALGNLFGRGR